MKNATTLLTLSLVIFLAFLPSSVFAGDWHGKKHSKIAGNVYAGTLAAQCSTGVDFSENDLITYNFDGTYTLQSQGVQRRAAVQISSTGVETSELVEYIIECEPVAFSIERFRKAFLIKNTEQTQCSGKYLSSAGNVTAGDSFTFSTQAGTQVTICDRELKSCQYSDSTLAEELHSINIVKLGGFFEFLATCSRTGSSILIDKEYRKHKDW